VIELVVLLLAIPVFWAFAEWRLGMLLCLVTGILQDPLRKLTPDQPVIFVVLVGVVFGAAYLGSFAQGVSLAPSSIFGSDRRITTPMWLLLLLIIFEAFNSYAHFGNPMITLIGLLTYLLPLPSIVFAYQLVRYGGEARIHQFITGYLLCTMLVLTTVYLEYAGYDWPVLGSVGGALPIYDQYLDGIIIPHSGIFRAPEIAAWHAMTCACFVLLVVTVRKFNFWTLLTAAIVVALLLGIGVLTGRRKTVIEVAVFVSTYFILWLVFQKGVAKLGVAAAIVGLIGFGWLAVNLGGDRPVYYDQESLGYYRYVERSKTVFQDAPSRFVELGIAPIMWAYDSFGVFGAGLGVGTQGTQHFGGGGDIAGAAEGGLGKVTLELGVPGLFVVGWFAILIFIYLWRIMRDASRVSPRIARLSIGLFSFLVANVAAFSVSTQAYADVFILLILSWTLGFLLAVPVLLEQEVRAQQLTSFEQSTPVFRPKSA
jgi:hypothetical protein